jgi:hypothetical protein
MIFAMKLCPGIAHERVQTEFNGLAGRGFRLAATGKIAALEKPAGEAGNRHGCDLDTD